MTRHCLPWTDLPETRSASGVAKRSLEGQGANKGASLVRVEVPAGTEAPRHSHDHAQFVQVIEGSGMLETEQGWVAFAAGSLFHFPAGTWHAASFETETVLVETNMPPASVP
ncbi:MAG: cupin domain-containing protein [Methylorubrum rhodinum]|uniref:cupin domain-containing protein n=1 Tax=Methylorubrum rhodinum TaxID=29428 RepID=UPI003BB14751